MRDRDARTAEMFGITDRIKAFEADLLKIEGIINESSSDGICIDLDGWHSNIKQVIIVPKYYINLRDGYYERRRVMIQQIIDVAKRHDLTRTQDSLEDYGEHLYIVFQCGRSWKWDF